MVKKDFNLEYEMLQVELTKSEQTNGLITIKNSVISRLIDSTNGEANLVRVFKDGHNCQSFLADSAPRAYGSQGSVQVTGPTLHSELDNAVVLPQNYPESNDPDFEYAAINVIDNPGAEGGEDSWAGDDFEAGLTAGDPWSAISGGNWNDITTIGVTSAAADTGTYSMGMNPQTGPAGIQRSADCRPSETVQITARVATPLVGDVGARLAIGVVIDEDGGGSIYSATDNSYYITSIDPNCLVAEVNNAAPGTGATPNTDFQDVQIRFKTGRNQTSFTFRFMILNAQNISLGLIDNIVITSEGSGVTPWYPWVGTTLDRQSAVVDTGSFAFRFQVLYPNATAFSQGMVQIMHTGANLGRRFTFKGRVRVASGTRNITGLIKKGGGKWAGSHTVLANTSGFIDFTATGIVDEEWFTIEVRDAQTANLAGGAPAGPIVYVDSMEGYWGLGTRTAGGIIQDHLEIIKARGVLTWLKTDSFDEVNDSNGVPWPQDEEITIWHGMTFLQLMGLFRQRGYEWDIVWNDSAEMYELVVFYPYTMGGDLTATDLKFHALNLTGAEVVESDPGANTFYGEGADGVYGEGVNAALVSDYGTREAWINDLSSPNSNALSARLVKAGVDAEEAKFSLMAQVGSWFTPGLTAGPGALVRVEMSGEVAERQERIARIVYTVEGTKERSTINFGSEYFGFYEDPDAATLAEILNVARGQGTRTTVPISGAPRPVIGQPGQTVPRAVPF